MGIHWFKYRPKIKKRRHRRPRVALNIDDLQIQDKLPSQSKKSNHTPVQKKQKDNKPVTDKSSTSNSEKTVKSETNLIASATIEEESPSLTASDTTGLNADPVIFAFNHLKRNPFEQSPYVKLIEHVKKEKEQIANDTGTGSGKETRLINANFSATIKTDNELVAVIDSRLYRKGDQFRSSKISSITPELVFLNTPKILYLIPKVGVKVNIASNGIYTYTDDFRKK